MVYSQNSGLATKPKQTSIRYILKRKTLLLFTGIMHCVQLFREKPNVFSCLFPPTGSFTIHIYFINFVQLVALIFVKHNTISDLCTSKILSYPLVGFVGFCFREKISANILYIKVGNIYN